MRRVHSSACVLVALFQAALASGQASQAAEATDSAGSGLLTRADAIRLALENNPELAALTADARVMAARPEAESALMPPMLEAQVFSWPFDTGNPANAEIMLMIEQEFPGRGKRQARAERARRVADRAANETAMRATVVAGEVKRAYADLWLARKSLDVYDAALALTRQVADAAEAKYVAGRSTQQDVVRAVVEMARLEERKITAREEARLAEARLNTLMNRRPDETVGRLEEPVDRFSLPSPRDLLQLAREQHPEFRAIDLDSAVADADLGLIDRERKPDLLVQGGYVFMPDETDAWTARVGITWPSAPWARKRFDAMALEATRMKEAAASRRTVVENRLTGMLQDAWVRASSAIERAELIRTSLLPQLEHSLDIARVAYQSDRADFLDVLESERQLLESRLDQYRAVAERDAALADIEQALGAEVL